MVETKKVKLLIVGNIDGQIEKVAALTDNI